jgi:hypothetical protein
MSKTNFRTLIIVSWILALAGYAARVLDAGGIPAQVQSAVNAVKVADMPIHSGLYNLFGWLYFFLFLASTIGTFAFRNWARYFYLAYFVAGLALGLLPPLTVYDRVHFLTGGLYSLSSIMILSLVFFSPVRNYFGGASADELR